MTKQDPMTKMIALNQSRSSGEREMDDAALVAAIARGDRVAMANLYDRYAPSLLALATRVVGDRVHAEDVLHDSLLEAWRRAGEYDENRGSVRAWLVTRVRSRALDEQLGSARRARLLRDNRVPLASACYRAPDADRSDGERVRRGLADLPAELGVVVDLVYYEGLSARAIGSRLRIPSGTVKSRLARAMMYLRRYLGADAPGSACGAT
jgi:RNA polymerase sigma-70 factor, ECF subfamily